MINAEEIIELEKKWLKYKIKQKSKIYLSFLLLVFILSALLFLYYFPQQTIIFHHTIKKDKKVKHKEYTLVKPIIKKTTGNTSTNPIPNNIVVKQEGNKTIVQKKPIKSYYFKLIPTEQGNQLFSSDGFFTYNSPIKKMQKPITEKKQVVQSIRKEAKILTMSKRTKEIKKRPTIEIDMKDVDPITYLKQKFYSTSSIVFALMLSEEYYKKKKYKYSLKWALTANDINSQNTKTWYWFAKSKVKLNKKEDAIRALKAYLSNNESNRLRILLKKIELGDTND